MNKIGWLVIGLGALLLLSYGGFGFFFPLLLVLLFFGFFGGRRRMAGQYGMVGAGVADRSRSGSVRLRRAASLGRKRILTSQATPARPHDSSKVSGKSR